MGKTVEQPPGEQASLEGDGYDANLLLGLVGARGGADVVDLHHRVHPLRHPTEDRVLAVQPRLHPALVSSRKEEGGREENGGDDGDEELGGVGVGAGVGHGDGVGDVVLEVRRELVRKLFPPNGLAPVTLPCHLPLFSRPSGPQEARMRTRGIPRLAHEALDDAVEDVPVVVAPPSVGAEVLHLGGGS